MKLVYRNDRPSDRNPTDPPLEVNDPAGIYVHWPFCGSKCSYCHFFSFAQAEVTLIRRYAQALIKEIGRGGIPAQYAPCVYDSIYFGGGTPSLIPLPDLHQILDTLQKRFVFASDVEITLEVNPESVHPEQLHAYRAMGINRLSMGVQSFDRKELLLLGRRHNVETIRKAYRLIRQAGFDNLSCDLIAGVPGQSLKKWQSNLKQLLELEPEHISLYLLEVYPGTPLDLQMTGEGKNLPPEKRIVAIYSDAVESCRLAGYEQYEISNFCRPGRASGHNCKYWKNFPILGFGTNSSYSIGRWRFVNTDQFEEYLQKVEIGSGEIRESTLLDETTWLAEYAISGLRLRQGIHLTDFKKRYGYSFEDRYPEIIEHYLQCGLLERTADSLRLADRALLVSNEILQDFLSPIPLSDRPNLRLV